MLHTKSSSAFLPFFFVPVMKHLNFNFQNRDKSYNSLLRLKSIALDKENELEYQESGNMQLKKKQRMKDVDYFSLFSELCWGKAMVAYTMPQQRKKEKRERLRGERDQMKVDKRPKHIL